MKLPGILPKIALAILLAIVFYGLGYRICQSSKQAEIDSLKQQLSSYQNAASVQLDYINNLQSRLNTYLRNEK